MGDAAGLSERKAGVIHAIKRLTRELIEACGGPAAVEQVTGVDRLTISRWHTEGQRELIPCWAVWLLESAHGVATFTRGQAAMSDHSVVAMQGEAAIDMPGLVDDMAVLAREAGEAVAALGAAERQKSPRALALAAGASDVH